MFHFLAGADSTNQKSELKRSVWAERYFELIKVSKLLEDAGESKRNSLPEAILLQLDPHGSWALDLFDPADRQS